ncbi:Z-ring formation inhibitor MciZ [Paenibacillus pinihumi]|uniref:Z-ring formation inhibitor MciZ n=1 Tax=Paenibacillus pinihumi TaxID=669462 RepID=UPI00040D342F|nr:Z-ring formation inhibitor MciZ [Paenibacillus pinihumi]
MIKVMDDKQLIMSGKAWEIRYMLRQLKKNADANSKLSDYLKAKGSGRPME